MKLTTRQTAEKLGVGISVITRLCKEGQLTDVGERQPGASKHAKYFDSKQVNELAKTFEPRKRLNSTAPAPQPITALGFKAQMDRMEAKLDALLKVWS